jgi:putative Ca2+/H+ antiporter (TMEM165/GDT1 family)
MAIMELNDVSYSHTLIMRGKYTDYALMVGSILAHMTSNFFVITIFWTIFSMMNVRSLKVFGCIVMYFLIAYELVFNGLKNMSVLMELQGKKTHH